MGGFCLTLMLFVAALMVTGGLRAWPLLSAFTLIAVEMGWNERACRTYRMSLPTIFGCTIRHFVKSWATLPPWPESAASRAKRGRPVLAGRTGGVRENGAGCGARAPQLASVDQTCHGWRVTHSSTGAGFTASASAARPPSPAISSGSSPVAM